LEGESHAVFENRRGVNGTVCEKRGVEARTGDPFGEEFCRIQRRGDALLTDLQSCVAPDGGEGGARDILSRKELPEEFSGGGGGEKG